MSAVGVLSIRKYHSGSREMAVSLGWHAQNRNTWTILDPLLAVASAFPPRELPEQRMLLAMLLWVEAVGSLGSWGTAVKRIECLGLDCD